MTETDLDPTERTQDIATRNGATSAAALKDDAADLHAAFLLGATISELQGRIRVAALDPTLFSPLQAMAESAPDRTDFVPYVEADSNIAWTTSAWRVLYVRLVHLHTQLFTQSTTRDTHYDPGVRSPHYFFPDEEPDYAQIGIAPPAEGNDPLQDFALAEATRRGLNCLTLLCIRPEVSLLPQVIADQQARLLALIPRRDDGGEVSLDVAISITVQQVLQLLHAWEGFLRESFYTAGVTARNENKLVAFEAGLAMVWLSWGVSVQALSPPRSDAPQQPETERLRGIWDTVFDIGDISRVQHQTAIVGKALDEIYAHDTDFERVAMTIKRSLDYWQRSVMWLVHADQRPSAKPVTADEWHRLRQALITQTGIWQSLLLGRQRLSTYTDEGVSQHIMQEVAQKFQLAAVSGGLFGAAEKVGETVAEELSVAAAQVKNVAMTAEHAIAETVGALVRSFWPLILVLLVVTVLGIVVLVQHGATGANNTLLADLTTPLVGLGGTIGLWFARDKIKSGVQPAPSPQDAETVPPPEPKPAAVTRTSIGDRVASLTGQVSGEVVAAFDRGFKLVQDDLKVLGQSVGITYPLIEFFVFDRNRAEINADIEFMDTIIWDKTDRHEEIVRVASVAFGAVGVFAVAATSKGTDKLAEP